MLNISNTINETAATLLGLGQRYPRMIKGTKVRNPTSGAKRRNARSPKFNASENSVTTIIRATVRSRIFTWALRTRVGTKTSASSPASRRPRNT